MKGPNGEALHWFDEVRHRDNKHKFLTRFVRLLYFRLVVPIIREKRGPQVIAWGAAIGLFVGMTPTVGIQIPFVILLWYAARRFDFHFSLIMAIAWSWLSNGATMVPLYYVFYVTGKAILPSNGSDLDEDSFRSYINEGLSNIDTFSDSMLFLWTMIQDIGLALVVGCLPYAIGFGALGYWLALVLAKRYQRFRHRND
ncbi:DUF2062 domain-containing protein [Aestuariispira insulae]|nr:DUF2062 domain-containing protein [Aestuariispira insulae]